MKQCFKCGSKKPLAEFYKHSQMGDGHLGKCKCCTKKDALKNRLDNIDAIREYDRNRGNRQGYLYVKEFRNKYPNAYKAHTKLNSAVKSKKILKPDSCEFCGSFNKIVGHHDDYLKPLEVKWLCQACHKQWHVKNGEGKNKV